MPHPKPAEGNVALISPPEGAVAAAAPAPEADDRWVWFEDEHGERFRVPRSWVQGTPADASNAGGSAEEADPDEAGGIHIKNPTLSRMFEGVRLTSGQASLVPKLQAFLDDDEARIFILRGYAGTGKTFLMKGVVDYLSAVNRSVHLMAPTGRAAKVLSTRTSRSASTIHAHLYSPRDRDDPDDEDFTLVSDLTSNTDELDAVYVVDEASMVSDRETQNPLLQFGSGRLLADLLHFLEDAPCAHRRHILFVGDAAQLPPVGMTVSPALSPVHLEEEFGLKPSEHTLTDIVRQKQDSGILALATALRTGLKNKTYALPRLPADVPDVERIDARDMARLCWEVMGRRITRDAVMIAQTNVRAQQLNRAFRRLQFPGVEELAAGDKLMVILNTHMHGEFICNGDFCQVLRTGARTRRSVSFRVKTGPAGKGRRLVNLDLEFQSVTLRLRGNTGECFEVSCMILLNQLEPEAQARHEGLAGRARRRPVRQRASRPIRLRRHLPQVPGRRMAARLRRLRMDGTEILGRLLPLALHRSDARQTEAPSRPLSEARLRRPERSPSRARRRLAPAMAGRASRKTSRRRPRDVRARASRRQRRSLLTPTEKQAAAFLQPPALPEPASSDKRGVPGKSLRLFLSNRRPVGLVDAAPLKDELLLRDHHDVPDLLEREDPAVADAPAPQGELPVRNLPALVLERRHVDGLGRAALVKDEALLPAEPGGHGLEPRIDVERHHLPVDSLAHGLLGRRGTACASCEHKGGCGQDKKHRSSLHGFPPVVTGIRSLPAARCAA